MANWGRAASLWFPIEGMPSSGPVLLTDETQTIQWLAEKPSKAAIDFDEHERDEHGAFLFDLDKDQQKPRMKSRRVKPVFWCPVIMES